MLKTLTEQSKPRQSSDTVPHPSAQDNIGQTHWDGDDEKERNLADTATDGMATVAAAAPYGARLFGMTPDSSLINSNETGPSSTVSFLQDVGKWTSSILNAVGKPETSKHTTLVSRAASPNTMTHVSVTETTGYIDPFAMPSDSSACGLLDLFFQDIGTSFQFIYKRHVMECYAAARKSGFQGVRKSFLCLLNAIFAFATYLGNPQACTPEESFAESEKFFTRSASLSHQRDAQSVDVETGQQFST